MSNDMFEIAIRNKFRFPFRGMVSVEDLWDLSLKDLDSIFKTLNSQIKTVNEESLLAVKTTEDEILNTKIEIVKYIFNVKMMEESERLQANEKKATKQKIMEIIASKKDADLQGKSIEELQAMIDNLK